MALESMTGFARASLEDEIGAVYWELRSVNGRGLETRLRLPPGHERLEQPARQHIAQRFSRGTIQATLNITQAASTRRPVVNEELLFDLARLAQRLVEEYEAEPARADGLLGLRGVLETPDATADEESAEKLDALALAALDSALDELSAARKAEGQSLRLILEEQLDKIEELTIKAEADPSREPSSIRARLEEQVRLLMETAPELDEMRLHQEAALLATKADIGEELDRLKTHILAARSLLSGAGPVGRRLDFLAQEFNRESNTLCSKSNAASITAIGVELKAVIDRFREQVQNLE